MFIKRGKMKFKKAIKVIGIVEIVILLATAIQWKISTIQNMTIFSDKLFTTSVIFLCLGFIISITSNSRKHYYKHLVSKDSKDKKVTKLTDEQFEEEADKRVRHSNYGLTVGISGVIGIGISALVLMV